MDNEIDWEEVRLTWPYMDKICELCVWALPSADLTSRDKHCRYFNKTVEPQLPACNYFVNWYAGRLL
ncbi:MAG: hypothetical protein FWC27_06225 [Firmicutes bacterium]|nr:hypothetical protein [Bacillota bacterium]